MIFGVLSVLAAAVLVGVDQLIKRWATAVLLPKTAMTQILGGLERADEKLDRIADAIRTGGR